MKSRVLYFPYIRVPESNWLTQMLLYWDQVSSIVPYEFMMNPEKLGSYMSSLVQEELVFPVMPGVYIYEIHNSSTPSTDILKVLVRRWTNAGRAFSVATCAEFTSKSSGTLATCSAGRGLASLQQYPWHDVERETADDFMSYLAASLGRVKGVDSSPVTDSSAYLQRFARAGIAQDAVTRQLESLRVQVLDRILPVPLNAIHPSRIRTFKEKHHDKLGDFRRRVERELIDASSVPDPGLRQRRLEIFFDEADVRIGEIQEDMRGAGWETARACFSVIAAVPGVSPILGLLGALWNAGADPTQGPQDFAYAAYAQSELKPGEDKKR
jgi:hypothetical protein